MEYHTNLKTKVKENKQNYKHNKRKYVISGKKEAKINMIFSLKRKFLWPFISRFRIQCHENATLF